MPVPSNRVPVVVARGNKATLDANLAQLNEGEIVLALDEDILYAVEGGALVAVGQAGGGGASAINELSDVDTTGASASGGTANFLRLNALGNYVPSGGNIKEDKVVAISTVNGASADAERIDQIPFTNGEFPYVDESAWAAAGYTYISGTGRVYSQIANQNTAFNFDPSTISTDWAEGTYLGVTIASGALWSLSANGSLTIDNDGLFNVADYNRQFNGSIYNSMELALCAVFEPSWAGAGMRQISATQWLVALQVCPDFYEFQPKGYWVEYVFNADGTVRTSAFPTDSVVPIPAWNSNFRAGVNLNGFLPISEDEKGFDWTRDTSESWSTLAGFAANPYSLTDFNGIDTTGVAAGDMAQFDADGNITPGHDALKEMTDISPNVPYTLYDVPSSIGGTPEPRPGVFRWFYSGGSFQPPGSANYSRSGSTIYFDGRAANFSNGYQEVDTWFQTIAGGGPFTFYSSPNNDGPWTEHTATDCIVDTQYDQYRFTGVSPTTNFGSTSVSVTLQNPEITGYQDGDVLAWNATEDAWFPRGKIDTDDFKALVAASTDFADFQTRVAAIPSYRP